MYGKIIYSQAKHSRCRLLLFIMLFLLVAAFFCLSGNLYLNSRNNIASAYQAFSTIAVLEFYGHTPGYEESADSMGLQMEPTSLCVVADLDTTLLRTLPGVKDIDFRQKTGVYLSEAVAYPSDREDTSPEYLFTNDLIRFTLAENELVIVSPYKIGQPEFKNVSLTVLNFVNPNNTYTGKEYRLISNVDWNVRGAAYSSLSPAQEAMLNDFNHNGYVNSSELVLEPGVEYLASGWQGSTQMNGVYYYNISFDWYGADSGFVAVSETGALRDEIREFAAADQPIAIWRWDQVQNDPVLSAYFEEVAQAYVYTACSFQAMTTQNMQGIPSFHQGNVYVVKGREFSQDDYRQGNPVCVISETLAKTQGWSVGDRIDLSFYTYDILTLAEHSTTIRPDYTQRNGGFFHQSNYEIIGIWKEKELKSITPLEVETEYIPWNTILVPTSSVQNLDTVDAPASGSRLTVHLENGMMEEFLEAASKVTLSESADEVRITAFDQGYSQAQDSLQSMLGTAQFLLVLSSVLLVVAGVLLAFFYTQSQKQNMALMRLLGCSRRQAGTMAMLGSLLILLPGGILGTAAGHLLTDRAASAILRGTSSLDKPEYAGFREIFGVQAEVDFALSAQPAVSAAALAAAAGLFLLGCMIFTLLHLRKEPREMLAEK